MLYPIIRRMRRPLLPVDPAPAVPATGASELLKEQLAAEPALVRSPEIGQDQSAAPSLVSETAEQELQVTSLGNQEEQQTAPANPTGEQAPLIPLDGQGENTVAAKPKRTSNARKAKNETP